MADHKNLIGSSWWVMVELIYLMGKYQQSCIFLPIDFNPISDEDYKFFTKSGNSMFVEMSWVCREGECRLEPPDVFSDKENPFSEYKNLLKSCVENSERMAVVPISLLSRENGKISSHSNFLVYDKKTNSVERFEPHGGNSPKAFQEERLDLALKEFFSEMFGDIEYFSPIDYCPKYGPQIYESIMREKRGVDSSFPGFCSVWSFVYANYRLKKPDIPRDKMVRFVTENIAQKRDAYEYALEIVNMLGELSEKIRISRTIEEIQEAVLDNIKRSKFL